MEPHVNSFIAERQRARRNAEKSDKKGRNHGGTESYRSKTREGGKVRSAIEPQRRDRRGEKISSQLANDLDYCGVGTFGSV